MCLIVFSWKPDSENSLLLAANRDEFYDRPSAAIHIWEDNNNIIGGRDEKEGGTWLAVNRKGKFSMLTNFRDPENIRMDAPSRGHLVSDYLKSDEPPEEYLQKLKLRAADYNGFNLLAGNRDELYYFSNYQNEITEIWPGVHGLSNHLLNTSWWKVEKAKRIFQELTQNNGVEDRELFELMTDEERAEDHQLPQTGIPFDWERAVSSMFIRKDDKYGTVNTTVLRISNQGEIKLTERLHNAHSTNISERSLVLSAKEPA
jgi:uncharacterized protein with NRDE domain